MHAITNAGVAGAHQMCLQLLWSQVVEKFHQRTPADVVAAGLGPTSLRTLQLTGHASQMSA